MYDCVWFSQIRLQIMVKTLQGVALQYVLYSDLCPWSKVKLEIHMDRNLKPQSTLSEFQHKRKYTKYGQKVSAIF